MSSKTKSVGSVALGAVALVFALSGCGSSSTGGNSSNTSGGASSPGGTTNSSNATATAAKPLITVKYSEVIRSVFYAPSYVAMSQGFFKQEGLDVQMVTSQGSDKGAAALLSGSADIALVGPETAAYIYNQHGSNTIKSFYQLTNTDGSFILSKKPISNFSWSDLQGKSIIGWRPGSAPQMVLHHVLQQKGVNANVITNIAAPAMVGAFEAGKADFIQEYEPTASQLIQSGKAYYDTSVGQAMGSYPETAFEATTSYINAHPDVIQAWSNAVVKATQWMDSHSSAEVAKAIAPYFTGTSTDLLVKSIDRYEKLGAWKTPVLTQSELDTLQSVLIENGTEKASQKVSYDNIVDPTFAQKATK